MTKVIKSDVLPAVEPVSGNGKEIKPDQLFIQDRSPSGNRSFFYARRSVLYFPSCPLLLRRKIPDMIHVSKITSIAERKDSSGKPVPFSFRAVLLSGEVIEHNDCIMTSHHSEGRTVNIKFAGGEIRKIKLISFIKFNGQEVFL